MKIIKILPEGLIDRIAAGEVIENPASAVKELLENSLDAGATDIEISITGGGKEEILIVDDGEGIPKDQVEIAFMRHATSKIRDFDDLLKTLTMGFRGEALPSISSVSIMELSTCARDENVGTRIRFEGGRQTHLGPAPPGKGCSISVRNLFYNVPARRKFLKGESSEKRKIAEVVRRYIIARPDVSFRISYDGKTATSYPSTADLRSRLEAVWGRNVAGRLLAVDSEPAGPVKVDGFISPLDITRANRSEVFFFVNSRPVIEKAFFGAIIAAFEGSLPRGQFPYAAVFLDIDTGFVDINVHPAKTEVRFSDTAFVFNTLKSALKKTLKLPASIVLKRPANLTNDDAIPFERAKNELLIGRSMPSESFSVDINASDRIDVNRPAGHEPSGIDHTFQIFDTYIIARKNGEIIIMDQHTAHERVLFEKTLKSLSSRPSLSQKLLFETRVKLTPEESATLIEISSFLTRAGFEIREFGEDEIIVSGMPQELAGISPDVALKDLLEDFSVRRHAGEETGRALAAAVACKAAVKAGHRLSDQQMRGLYADLMRCEEPFRCPHGRPTMAVLNRNDLEKIFHRK